jgi:hypothetical protein
MDVILNKMQFRLLCIRIQRNIAQFLFDKKINNELNIIDENFFNELNQFLYYKIPEFPKSVVIDITQPIDNRIDTYIMNNNDKELTVSLQHYLDSIKVVDNQ